jgi:hypothetical protein
MNAVDAPPLALPEAIERLEAMPRFLEAALAAAAASGIARRPREGEFSLVEHACHLRDLEREGYLVRVRRMLEESRPVLAPFDGAAVAAQRDYLAQDAHRAAGEFGRARHELTQVLATLGEDALRREGAFGDRPVCLADLVAMMVEHDRGHREEIARLVDFLEEA